MNCPACPSPHRMLMASTHVNHNIYITEVKTGKCLHSLVGHRRTPWCVTFHPTIPGLVASGCLDGEVRIWDLHVSIQGRPPIRSRTRPDDFQLRLSHSDLKRHPDA